MSLTQLVIPIFYRSFWKQVYRVFNLGYLKVSAKGHKGLRWHLDHIIAQNIIPCLENDKVKPHSQGLEASSVIEAPQSSSAPKGEALRNLQTWSQHSGTWGLGPKFRMFRRHFFCFPQEFFPSLLTYRTLESCWRGWSRRSRLVRKWRGWREDCRKKGLPGRCDSFQSRREMTGSCWTEMGFAGQDRQREGSVSSQPPHRSLALVIVRLSRQKHRWVHGDSPGFLG